MASAINYGMQVGNIDHNNDRHAMKMFAFSSIASNNIQKWSEMSRASAALCKKKCVLCIDPRVVGGD